MQQQVRRRDKPRSQPNLGNSRFALEKIRYTDKWESYIEKITLGRFKWEGLPDSVSERFIEYTLMRQGQAVFFKLGGPEGKLVCTRVMASKERVNLYEDPQKLTALASNGFSYEIPKGEGVMVWDSETRRSPWMNLQLFATELVRIDLQDMTNLIHQRAIIGFSGPESAKNDLSGLLRDLEANEVSRLTYVPLHEAGVKVEAITTGIEYKQDQYSTHRLSKLSELYTYLGIESIGYNKKAHVLEEEAAIATDSILRVREEALAARRTAADEINKKFGLNVTVKWRTDEQNTTHKAEGGDGDE